MKKTLPAKAFDVCTIIVLFTPVIDALVQVLALFGVTMTTGDILTQLGCPPVV